MKICNDEKCGSYNYDKVYNVDNFYYDYKINLCMTCFDFIILRDISSNDFLPQSIREDIKDGLISCGCSVSIRYVLDSSLIRYLLDSGGYQFLEKRHHLCISACPKHKKRPNQ